MTMGNVDFFFFKFAKSYLLEVHYDELEKDPQWLNFHLLRINRIA